MGTVYSSREVDEDVWTGNNKIGVWRTLGCFNGEIDVRFQLT